jgi:hypothetical protein
MKRAITIVMLLCCCSFGQTPTYYHDPALDTIANNIGFMDSDMNALNFGSGMTAEQYKETNALMGATTQSQLNHNFGATLTNFDQVASSNSIISTISTNALGAAAVIGGIGNMFTNIVGTNLLGLVGDGHVTGVTGYAPTFYGGDTGFGVVHSWTIDLSLADWISGSGETWVGTMFSSLYVLLIVVFTFITFRGVWEDFMANLNDFIKQRQIQGSTESIFGVNLSAPVAIVYGGIMVGLIAVCVTGVLTSGCITGLVSVFSSLFSDTTFFGLFSYPIVLTMYQNVTMIIPVTRMVQIGLTAIVFRYATMPLLFYVARMIFKFLPA